jgi:lipoate-protein ligase A
MKLLDLSLPTPAENLALDEALLDQVETADTPVELLRFWESSQLVVVVGRSSRVAEEVDLVYCRDQGIPVLRRCSGGAAVVIGPGCFMFSVVLRFDERPELRMIERAHRFVLEKTAAALGSLQVDARFRGTSDLAVDERKISGNSLRCKRQSFLYHGTILYDIQPDAIARCLLTAPRQPAYRRGRTHVDFVTNVPLLPDQIRSALAAEWETCERVSDWPRAAVERLARERYLCDEWNLRY